MEQTTLNAHNKEEYPPMHTAEHILNRTMVNMYGCPRSRNTHIEKKKGKCDYFLSNEPSEMEISAIEAKVNDVIAQNLPVTFRFVTREEAEKIVDTEKLPDDVSDTIRLVFIGNYDSCACIGNHVENTSEIGQFRIISHDYENGRLRIRFKLDSK